MLVLVDLFSVVAAAGLLTLSVYLGVEPYGPLSQSKLAGSDSSKHQFNRPAVVRPVLGRPPVLKEKRQQCIGSDLCCKSQDQEGINAEHIDTTPDNSTNLINTALQRPPMAVLNSQG